MENKLKLIIPVVKNYGCVFIINDEPFLFILDHNNKITDKIDILGDFENDEEDLYLFLDDDEMILVSVDILDTLYNDVDINDVNDNNRDDLIYRLTPLKIKCIEKHNIDMNYIMNKNILEEYLNDVVSDYKISLKLTLERDNKKS